MGMKLKSGADLCGFQLTNFCVQGEASAPSDAALGRKYFHTNATDDVATGISLLNRERIYLGEGAWRATAYLDDIAAINEKLNLITGDTDTDTLINNLKDLEEFLKDFSETDKLKSLLDGKLSTSGGTIRGAYSPLVIQRQGDAVGVAIEYKSDVRSFGYIGAGIKDGVTFPFFDNGTTNTLIHSGNIGSYKAGDSNKLGGYLSSSYAFLATYPTTSNDNWNLQSGIYKTDVNSVGLPYPNNGNSVIHCNFDGNAACQLFLMYSSDYFAYRRKVGNVWQDWKTIAFTDSDITGSAARLKSPSGLSYASADGNEVILGYMTSQAAIDTYLEGYNLYLRYGTGHSTGLILNSSGNVLIGTTTDKGHKFAVYGVNTTDSITAKTLNNAVFSIGHIDQGYGLSMWTEGNGHSYIQAGRTDGSGSLFNLSLQRFGGKLLIGTATRIDNNSIVQIKGDIHVTGNIIADGEVSAGGAGAEEGTSGSGSAEGVSEVFTPTSTSMAFDHNLGEDVIVQVYEKSGNVWNMVIVDTEITSATRVTLRFGKTETTQHKVVIMGV